MFYRYLDSKFKAEMKAHSLSDDELRQASEGMKAKSNKYFKIGMVCYAIIVILMTGGTIWEYMMKPELSLGRAISYVVISIVFGYFVAYFLPVGIVKFEFNHVLKNTYPHLFDECKL